MTQPQGREEPSAEIANWVSRPGAFHDHRWRWATRLLPVGSSLFGFGVVFAFTNLAVGLAAIAVGLLVAGVFQYGWSDHAFERSRVRWIDAGQPDLRKALR